MEKGPDPGADLVSDKVRPSNIWTRATYYEGLMALYSVDTNQVYYDYAVDWGESHDWAPAYGSTRTRDADNQCCGQTYIELYQIEQKSERITGIKRCIDRMVNSDQSDDWWWIDAIQMAMPVFAKLGTIYNDNNYFEKMYDLFNYTKTRHGDNGLYNPVDHLWWRDSDFDPPYVEPNGEDCYWSRGNGWVFAGLARVLDVLPEDAPNREEYLTIFLEMADALLAVQRTDGFWNVSLHDPNNFGGKELSGTAFFTFGLAWGVNNGFLFDVKYQTAFINAWNGMANDALHPNGFLGYVQGTGKEPASSQPVTYDGVPNFEDFGLGAFLLAGSEVYKFAEQNTAVDFAHHGRGDNPGEFKLHPVYPNPFNPETNITYQLDQAANVSLTVFNLIGEQVITFHKNVPHESGIFNLLWNGTDARGRMVPSGTYIIYLQVGDFVATQKAVLLK
jgi:unsaturated rhamnogalacturonyl hydrolase